MAEAGRLQETQADDPLAALEVNVEQVSRSKLAHLLEKRARIDPEAGRILIEPAVRDLTADRVILVALAAQLALRLRQKAKGLTELAPAGLSPKELQAPTGLPGGTIRPRLRSLVEGGLVVKGGDEQRYTILGHALDQIERQLQETNS